MSDLVKALRQHKPKLGIYPSNIRLEAADRIEELEGTLHDLLATCHSDLMPRPMWQEALDKASKALEGE